MLSHDILFYSNLKILKIILKLYQYSFSLTIEVNLTINTLEENFLYLIYKVLLL